MTKEVDCVKCQGKRIILRATGEIGPCFDCLIAGRMDQHDKNPKDSGIKV